MDSRPLHHLVYCRILQTLWHLRVFFQHPIVALAQTGFRHLPTLDVHYHIGSHAGFQLDSPAAHHHLRFLADDALADGRSDAHCGAGHLYLYTSLADDALPTSTCVARLAGVLSLVGCDAGDNLDLHLRRILQLVGLYPLAKRTCQSAADTRGLHRPYAAHPTSVHRPEGVASCTSRTHPCHVLRGRSDERHAPCPAEHPHRRCAPLGLYDYKPAVHCRNPRLCVRLHFHDTLGCRLP